MNKNINLQDKILNVIREYKSEGYNIICLCLSRSTIEKMYKECDQLITICLFAYSIFGVRIAVNDENKDFILIETQYPELEKLEDGQYRFLKTINLSCD